ncbi:MAG: glycoside hydrolase family 9 protein [Chitinispirillales bacterium]|jgi:endoglucanase|nr:glycoside hydrolase family 9 protein [Chitinispirillales bacterium]
MNIKGNYPFTLLVSALVAIGGAFSTALSQTIDSRVRLNSAGFLPGFPKKATVAAEFTKFWLYEAPNGTTPVYSEGTVSEPFNNTDTRENGLRIADFSDFNTPGRYFLRTNNTAVGKSPEFTIGNDVFTEPFRAAMLGFYLWRCGAAVSAAYNGRSYSHGACHKDDGSLKYYVAGRDDGTGNKDGVGGWHDAGDYNKYTVNSGAAVAFTLKAWEHFWHILENTPLVSVPNSGAIPAYLAEVKWNLDWVRKMQFSDGRVSHKLSTLNFGGEIMPESESATRYYAPWNTMATASFVGQMAIAARIYAPYDGVFAARCLGQARISYSALMDTAFVRHTQAPFLTGEYGGSGDTDKRLWAAAEMWETTGEPGFLEYLESRLPNMDVYITWSNVSTVAALTYLNSRREGRNPAKVERLRADLIGVADELITVAAAHGYARVLGSNSYFWGANGSLAGTAYVFHSAYLQTGDPKYRHAVQDAAAHLLGRNYYGRSFVTGVGHNPPTSPHDRTSTASRTPWPGRLIGGPHSDKNGAPTAITNCASPATCWFDDSRDYWTNEVAINWNAPLAYTLAALMPGADTYPARPYPGQTVETEVSVNHNAKPKKASAGKNGATRVVRARGDGRLDIPAGAKVYGLNGKLIARKLNAGSKMPVINRNGVYLIKIEGLKD